MKFTEKQKHAIETKDKDILISAAAGSGKTTVLANRVLKLIIDGADIRRMLICTYTRLAASELRQRIYESLLRAADELGDARLRAQAEHVAGAYIGTIHSFCTQVISDNFLKAGLAIGWRTANGALAERLANDACEEALSQLYEEENEDMLWLSERYGARNDKRLIEYALDIYHLSRSMPEGIDWLKKDSGDFSSLIEENTREYVYDRINLARSMSDSCFEVVENYEDFERQRPYTIKMRQNIEALAKAYETSGISGLGDALNSLGRLVSAKNLIPEEAKRKYTLFNDVIKKSCIQKLKDFCAITSNSGDTEGTEAETRYMQKLNGALYVFLSKFEQIFSSMKGELGVLDYDDLIHTAYSLLTDEETAQLYKDKIDYVFVDEFQDTNSVQDALIERICAEGNRFIVGDVKQSIYSFRLADPRVFLKKTEEIKRAGEVVYMNDNFRSSFDIIADINALMEKLMTKNLGGIAYTKEERLKPNRQETGHPARFLCAVFDEADQVECEANAIADEIEGLLQEGFRLGDVAILLRSKAGADKLKQTLEARGIPAYFDGALSSPAEIDLFVEHLKLIDSDNDDIAMLAVMRSPAAGFDEEDFAKIRAYTPEESFSCAVKRYRECEKDPELAQRAEKFLLEIDRLRLLAYAMPMEEFLLELKKYTRFDEILGALAGGEVRADSFSRFFDNLLEYAKDGGLYELLCTLEQVRQKNQGSYTEASESALPDDCVKIMTIHASKGLQFKVVFIAFLHKRFNLRDAQDAIISDTSWGAVSRIYDVESLRSFPTLSYELAAQNIKASSRSEELRVLYVALTRAEERLYLTCAKKQEEEQKIVPPQEALSFYDWISYALYDRLEYVYNEKPYQEAPKKQELEELLLKAKDETSINIVIPSFEKIPVKMGVSSLLSPYELESSPNALTVEFLENDDGLYSEKAENSNSQNSGAEFGTLVHAFLQHYDYGAMPAIESQLGILKEKKLFSEEECRSVLSFKDELEGFLNSDMAKRIGHADEVFKELPFSIGVSARELGYDGDDMVVIQGIIDVVIKEKDKYSIIDYKTNRSTDYERLKEHYSKQMEFYSRALFECMEVSASECLLCFIRTGVTISLSLGDG